MIYSVSPLCNHIGLKVRKIHWVRLVSFKVIVVWIKENLMKSDFCASNCRHLDFLIFHTQWWQGNLFLLDIETFNATLTIVGTINLKYTPQVLNLLYFPQNYDDMVTHSIQQRKVAFHFICIFLYWCQGNKVINAPAVTLI